MRNHGTSISAIADTSSGRDRGRAFFHAIAIASDMGQESWRNRLQDVIDRDKRSMRDVSLAAGLSAGYVHGILKDGKDPTIDRLSAVASALNVSLSYILVGMNVSPETERVIQALENDPDRRSAILQLLPK